MHPSQDHRTRHLDWKPDRPDFRDHIFAVTEAIGIPAKVDLRAHDAPIWDQGQLGCCTGFGCAAVLAHIHPGLSPSELFIYYNERVIEGTVKEDSGAAIRDGVKVLATVGAPPTAAWPYVTPKFAKKPPPSVFKKALPNKVSEYQRLSSGSDFKTCLAGGFPIVFGFTCYESLEGPLAAAGYLPMPKKTEKVIGGHCVVLVGYGTVADFMTTPAGVLSTDPVYLVRNSWGTSWGLEGYFLMPAAYVENANLATDFWTVRK